MIKTDKKRDLKGDSATQEKTTKNYGNRYNESHWKLTILAISPNIFVFDSAQKTFIIWYF